MAKKQSSTPVISNGQPTRTMDIDFKSAMEKGGERIAYEARVTFLSESAMLEHAAEHVKWNLQKLANKGEFPTGRRVEVSVSSEIVVKRTDDDEVTRILNMSEEERNAQKLELERLIRLHMAAQSVGAK